MWRLQFDVYENLNWLFPSTPLFWKLWCYICLTCQLIHWFYLHWHKCLCNWKRSTLCAQKSWWWFIQRRWWRDKDSQAVVSGISTIISAAWHFVNMRCGYHCPVDGSTGINFNTSQLSGMTSGFLPWTHDQFRLLQKNGWKHLFHCHILLFLCVKVFIFYVHSAW